jgi:hypothetical protein
MSFYISQVAMPQRAARRNREGKPVEIRSFLASHAGLAPAFNAAAHRRRLMKLPDDSTIARRARRAAERMDC